MKFSGRITPGKLIALIIVCLGFYLSLVLKDVTAFTTSIMFASLIYGAGKAKNTVVDFKHGRFENKIDKP